MKMFIHFFCLCRLVLTIKLNINILKRVYYPLEERLSIVVISSIVKHLCSIAQQFHIIAQTLQKNDKLHYYTVSEFTTSVKMEYSVAVHSQWKTVNLMSLSQLLM